MPREVRCSMSRSMKEKQSRIVSTSSASEPAKMACVAVRSESFLSHDAARVEERARVAALHRQVAQEARQGEA